uniref:Xylanolytic transcriptional activator regulatory domain-containing protein n=1 Tax=Moniliophthora roreri TaxID=221103 RepID=A0A0W0EWG7_MONRR
MSSDEEGTHDIAQKRQRITRACDTCRKKKIRCRCLLDSETRITTNWLKSQVMAYKCPVPHVHHVLSPAVTVHTPKFRNLQKRGPPISYVENLALKREQTQRTPRQLLPKDLELNPENNNSKAPSPSSIPHAGLALDSIRKWGSVPVETKEDIEAKDEEDEQLELSDTIKRLSIGPEYSRFFGKSSVIMLIRAATDLKEEYTRREGKWGAFLPSHRRPEFWQRQTWEHAVCQIPRHRYVFPADDLMNNLVDLYFKNVNIFMPLLHRPTFERDITMKLHLKNDMFGAILLLVCANGSRYSDDPRVLLDETTSWSSCGWKWFDQVHLFRTSLLSPPSLYDLQFYCLSCQFLQGSSTSHVSPKLTVESELLKRAFWVLVCMDRAISAGLGRSCAIQDEDFDLDMPVECDDEYWEHPNPEMAFKQPPGKPSYVTAFVSYLKLMRLLAMALRTIYCINKSKMMLGFTGPQWEQRVVSELDSALNQWVDSVPEHLRWDPNREDEIFFNQSAVLYTQYYVLQIVIHRPFISSPKRPSPLSFPSLAICTNAARSCSHIVDLQRRRKGFLLSMNRMAVFNAGVVLLLNIWGAKRSGLSTDPNREMADVHKCMQVLRVCEKRWHGCGRLWDVLYELASVGDLPLPNSREGGQNKRDRDSDSPRSTQASNGNSPGAAATEASERSTAGSKRVMKSSSSTASTTTFPSVMSSPSVDKEQPNQQFFSLPLYSDELGRLPSYGQLHYTSHGSQVADAMDPSNTSSGYWFTSQEAPQMSPTYMTAATIGVDSGMNLPFDLSHDLSLPAGYPSFSDADFFEQLASMTCPSGPDRMAGGGWGIDSSADVGEADYQQGQHDHRWEQQDMWSQGSWNYMMNDLIDVNHDYMRMPHEHTHNP